MDAIVVGAGVVGLTAGWTLARSGVQRVLVLERLAPAAGASGMGAGSVTVQRWWPEDVALMRRSEELMDQLAARSGGAFRLYTGWGASLWWVLRTPSSCSVTGR